MSYEDKKDFDAPQGHVLEAASVSAASDDYHSRFPLATDPHRGLRMRHVQLIAISGSIGAALFVSIGNPLTAAGPIGLLLGVIIWSFVVWTAANCLIEMTTLLPLDGGFINFSGRFVDQSMCCALGWNYVITQFALICLELVTLNIIVSYWVTLHPAILISVGIVVLGILNIYSVRWYGEFEFWLSITKVLLMLGLTLYTFVTMVGGNPLHDKYGFRYWKVPGPFASETAKGRVTGIFDAICWCTFAIVGPDYISLVGGEVKSPRRVLPKAFRATSYRIVFFYVVGALCVGIVCAANDPSLLGAISKGAPGAAKSPYVISMNRLQIPFLPSLVNALVLVSLFSTTNSFVFAASRSILGLGLRGQAPKFFCRLNKQGVPYVAVLFTLLISALSYLSVSAGTVKVLNWWISLVGAAQLVSWSCIAITYLRFRSGLKAQGLLHGDFLPAKGYWQPFSGWWLMVWSPIVFLFSGYYCFLPGAWDAPTFVFAYGSIFIFAAIYMASKVYQVTVQKAAWGWVKAADMDFVTNRAEIEELTKQSEEMRAMKPRSKGQKLSDALF